MAVLPYKESADNKKKQVAGMFDNISRHYDLLNHLLSLNIDKSWRRKAINLLKSYNPLSILDVATGTADFAISACRILPEKITGIDISEGMLSAGREKVANKGLSGTIELICADSENLPFPDKTYDAALAAFGVRNFENLEAGLSEVLRVLKAGAPFVILEFSKPGKTPFKQVYSAYFKYVLPFIGRIVSSDRSAYTYLHDSVVVFPYGKNFLEILGKVGFENTTMYPLTFGVATIYIGHKPKS